MIYCCLQRSQSKGTKHHHRKKHTMSPANSEALNQMSSAYGSAGESFIKPKRQHSTAARKAEQEHSGSGEDADYV